MRAVLDAHRELVRLGAEIESLQAVDAEVAASLDDWRSRTEQRLHARGIGRDGGRGPSVPHARPYLMGELQANFEACATFLAEVASSHGVTLPGNGATDDPDMDPATSTLVSLSRRLAAGGNTPVAGYVEETIDCFTCGAYRASVIMSWVGAVSVLQSHVARNHLGEFNKAARVHGKKPGNRPWQDAKSARDLVKLNERAFLRCLKVSSILSKGVFNELCTCLDLRNACGHPTDLRLERNRVAAHIEVLVLNVYSKYA